jgi:hypothetical protein
VELWREHDKQAKRKRGEDDRAVRLEHFDRLVSEDRHRDADGSDHDDKGERHPAVA